MVFLYEPPERVIKRTSLQRPVIEARAESAVKYMGKVGVPVNPQVAARIVTLLSKKQKENRREVLGLIKQDPGVFFHCVKNLHRVHDSERMPNDLMKVLGELEEDQFNSLLAFSSEELNEKDLKNMTRSQAGRYQHWLISTMAAESMAPNFKINGDLAFGAAALRQLSYTLIAWNYPSVFAMALSRHRRLGADLDEILTEQLGVSPLGLMDELSKDWGLSTEIRQIFAPQKLPPKGKNDFVVVETDVHAAKQMNLLTLCETAELVAKTKDLENFPEAKEEWLEKSDKIKAVFDTEKLEEVEAKVKTVIGDVLKMSSAIASMTLGSGITTDLAAEEEVNKLLYKNLYAQKCPKPIKYLIAGVYRLMEVDKVSINALKYLVETVVPRLGFSKGCFFLMDTSDYSLKPVLRFGDLPLERYEFALHNSPLGREIHTAFETSFPLKVEGLGVDGSLVTYITSGLQGASKPGVFYLELSRQFEGSRNEELVIFFRAILRALLDALKL